MWLSLNHFFTTLPVCFGSLSCWKIHLNGIFHSAWGSITSLRMLLYITRSIIRLVWLIEPIPLAEKHPQIITLPLPCFSAFRIYRGSKRFPTDRRTRKIPSLPIILNFYSSLNRTVRYFSNQYVIQKTWVFPSDYLTISAVSSKGVCKTIRHQQYVFWLCDPMQGSCLMHRTIIESSLEVVQRSLSPLWSIETDLFLWHSTRVVIDYFLSQSNPKLSRAILNLDVNNIPKY